MLELGMRLDYSKLLIDCEIAKMIRRVVSGFSISEESLALDVIQQVGACGEFVSHEHTFHNFKTELSQTKLFDRSMFEVWVAAGGKDLQERANEEVRKIYENYRPDPLPKGAASKMRAIVNEAEEHYGLDLSRE